MGIPTRIKSLSGNRDGEEMFPIDVRGDGDEENLSPQGRGWWLVPDGEFSVAIFSSGHRLAMAGGGSWGRRAARGPTWRPCYRPTRGRSMYMGAGAATSTIK
jgi:hypothetical protein